MSDDGIVIEWGEEERAPDPEPVGDWPVNPVVWIAWGAGEELEGRRRVLKGESVVGFVSAIALDHSEGMAFGWAGEEENREKYPEGRVAYMKLRDEEGTDFFLTLTQMDLLARLRERNPGLGDKVKVVFEGTESFTTSKGSRRRKNVYDVRIKRFPGGPRERAAFVEESNVYQKPLSAEEMAAKVVRDSEAPF